MLKFDHLVHLTRDPHQTAQMLRNTGLNAVEGGRHEDWGTYNALCYFDLSYIEFLGVENPDTARKSEQNPLVRQAVHLLPQTEGLARIAIRTEHIEQLADELRGKGLAVKGPFPGSRTRSDGSVIRWSLLFPESNATELVPPFFIQWEQGEGERQADLRERRFIAVHPLGDLQLARIVFAVRDVERRIAEWADWFGLQAGKRYTDHTLQAECQELQLPGGNVLFCSPSGKGELSELLETRGEIPFRVDITGSRHESEQRLYGATYRFLK